MHVLYCTDDVRTACRTLGATGGTPADQGPWEVHGAHDRAPCRGPARPPSGGSSTWCPPPPPSGSSTPTGLEVTGPLPGRALVALAVCRYDDTDLDSYHEVAVSFVVRPHDAPRTRPPVDRLREFASGAIGAYIHRLPVDQEFTCAAGPGHLGIPEVDHHHRHRRARAGRHAAGAPARRSGWSMTARTC